MTTPTLAAIAKRFRPYLKFSVESGFQEPIRPCPWPWFYEHATKTIAAPYADALQKADLRLGKTTNDSILLGPTHLQGPDWSATASGEALYCHVTGVNGFMKPDDEIGHDGFINLEYWILFGFNQSSASLGANWDIGTLIANAALSHTGDLVGIQMVYDARVDHITRVAYCMHGSVVAAFDIPEGVPPSRVQLSGVDFDKKPIQQNAVCYQLDEKYAHQKGPWEHSPSDRKIYFVMDPETQRPDHLAVFFEWGTHEPWPNSTGSFSAAPKHRGDGISFLPADCHVLRAETDAPFMYYGGKFGDPTSVARHSTWRQDDPAVLAATNPPKDWPPHQNDASPYGNIDPLKWPPTRVDPKPFQRLETATGHRSPIMQDILKHK